MKVLITVFALLLVVAVGNAQVPVSSFPYYYDWTSPASFALQSDNHTYVGGDGSWACYRNVTKPQFVTDATNGWVSTNQKDALDTLLIRVDATGRTFNGTELFTFYAWRSGGATTGTLWLAANGTLMRTIDVATGLSTTSAPFSVTIPPSLGNSIFTISVVVNTSNVVFIDRTGISGGALPITLASLKLNLDSATPVLSWTTISEIDNYGFYVQKSQDGVSWTEIPNSFQQGYGTTTEKHTYTFSDNTLPAGNYYRLHQVDLDGTSHYSQAVSVVATVEPASTVKEFALSQSYPNPFNPVTRIKYTVGVTGGQWQRASVKLVVYDLLGREVATLVNEQKQPGSYEVTFDGRGLASGIYIYCLTAGSFTDTKSMVLMK